MKEAAPGEKVTDAIEGPPVSVCLAGEPAHKLRFKTMGVSTFLENASETHGRKASVGLHEAQTMDYISIFRKSSA
jgi:hypothetical protein